MNTSTADHSTPHRQTPIRSRRLPSLLVPPLAVFILLYQVLASLQVTVLRSQTLTILVVCLCAAGVMGVIAAFGGRWLRAAVLGLVAVLWIDATFDMASAFSALTPDTRRVAARDRARLSDLGHIKAALERHIAEVGPLPMPAAYDEQTGAASFWGGWWDLSAHDGNDDGRPFLEFLVDRGLMTTIPVDPLNIPHPDGHPSHGQQYAYFVAPAGYDYQGGHCGGAVGAVYLLGITDLEREHSRPPLSAAGSGCECLWRDAPDFFQQYFDYILCGRAQQ